MKPQQKYELGMKIIKVGKLKVVNFTVRRFDYILKNNNICKKNNIPNIKS